MNFKFLLLLAIIAAGGYYWYTQNPGGFGSTGNGVVNAVSSDVSKAEGKMHHLR